MMDKIGRFKPHLLWVTRILGTALFLWFILRTVDLGDLLGHIRSVSLLSYILLFCFFLFNQALSAYRWRMLLGMIGVQEPFKPLFLAILYGQTINKLLPSSIGGDSARVAYLLSRHPGQKSKSVSATLLDRFLSYFALIVLAVVSLPFGSGLSLRQKLIGGLALGSFLLLVGVIYGGTLDRSIARLLNLGWLPEVITRYLNRFWAIFLEYREERSTLLQTVALSLIRQALMILNIYFTFQVVGVQVPLVKLFLVIPIVTLLVILPISIGGVGVREAALVSMLGIRGEFVLSFTMIRYSYLVLLPLILLVESVLSRFIEGLKADAG